MLLLIIVICLPCSLKKSLKIELDVPLNKETKNSNLFQNSCTTQELNYLAIEFSKDIHLALVPSVIYDQFERLKIDYLPQRFDHYEYKSNFSQLFIVFRQFRI